MGSTVTRSPQSLLDSLQSCLYTGALVRRLAPQSSWLWSKNGPSSYQDSNRLQRRGPQGTPSGGLVIDSHCRGLSSPENSPCFRFLVSQGNWGDGTTCPLEAQTDSVREPRGVQRRAWLVVGASGAQLLGRKFCWDLHSQK